MTDPRIDRQKQYFGDAPTMPLVTDVEQLSDKEKEKIFRPFMGKHYCEIIELKSTNSSLVMRPSSNVCVKVGCNSILESLFK